MTSLTYTMYRCKSDGAFKFGEVRVGPSNLQVGPHITAKILYDSRGGHRREGKSWRVETYLPWLGQTSVTWYSTHLEAREAALIDGQEWFAQAGIQVQVGTFQEVRV